MIASPESIAAEAKRWVGTPWHHQGALRGVGADCIGLVVGVAAACGVREADQYRRDPVARAYGREPDPLVLLTACDRYLQRIAIESSRLGDVLVFTIGKHIQPRHFGIISREGPRYIVHAYVTLRGVVEHRLDVKWARRVLRAYRFKEAPE